MNTPWGESDYENRTDVPGVVFYSTPSHGGFFVSDEAAREMPAWARDIGKHDRWAGGWWFEEDCDWAAVGFVWPAIAGGSPDVALRVLQYWHGNALPLDLRAKRA